MDSDQFFNSAILAKFSIVSLRLRSLEYPSPLHCAQIAIDLVKCCTNEISCAHRLKNIRGNIDTHTYIHAYIHTCIHTYIHTYIQSYIHTYIHTWLKA